jgi:hypothetical protein
MISWEYRWDCWHLSRGGESSSRPRLLLLLLDKTFCCISIADSITNLLEEKEEDIISVHLKCLQHNISRYQQLEAWVRDYRHWNVFHVFFIPLIASCLKGPISNSVSDLMQIVISMNLNLFK